MEAMYRFVPSNYSITQMKHPKPGTPAGEPTHHPQPDRARLQHPSPQAPAPATQQQALLAAMQDMLLEFDPRLWTDSPDEDDPALL